MYFICCKNYFFIASLAEDKLDFFESTMSVGD